MVAIRFVILAVTLGASMAVAEDLSSKNDFRGIACGAPAPSGMKKGSSPEKDWQYGASWTSGTTAYSRSSDRLTMGDVKLQEITYYFFEGHFFAAEIVPTQEQQGDAELLDTLVAAFGPPSKIVALDQPLFAAPNNMQYGRRWEGPHMIVKAPSLVPTFVASAEFICKDVSATIDKKRNELMAEDKQRRLKGAHPKAGDL